jgi:hypothetical protein
VGGASSTLNGVIVAEDNIFFNFYIKMKNIFGKMKE